MHQIKEIPRINNFDIIRLLAAFQVVYLHAMSHLKIEGPVAIFYERFLQYFPGVPIFFTVSGFLIFWAFDRNQNIKKYTINRILRLYPALYVCLGITIILLFLFSSIQLFANTSFYIWLVGQLSIFQFYTPDLLRFWGVGTPNGSLWTIAVEVQFYILVPIIFFLIRRFKGSVILTLLFLVSVIANLCLSGMSENAIQKLSFVSIIPHLFNFLIGSSFYIFWNKIHKLIEGKFFFWGLIYAAYIIVFGNILGYDLHAYRMTSIFHITSAILLSLLTLSFAFSFNDISGKLLKHNDISYGVYIYHMLVVNTLVALGLRGNIQYFITVFVVTGILAFISWKLIEKPALSLKNKF